MVLTVLLNLLHHLFPLHMPQWDDVMIIGARVLPSLLSHVHTAIKMPSLPCVGGLVSTGMDMHFQSPMSPIYSRFSSPV